jgi:hypothetical protein
MPFWLESINAGTSVRRNDSPNAGADGKQQAKIKTQPPALGFMKL